ncbi:hypothetical protein [Acinetobacter venetianus]|uniref:hypothetical protein n=1 Tax=Acinetobacter venetianus TaxID=52133 RepID=UPI003A9385DE
MRLYSQKVVYMESVRPDDNAVYEVKEMKPTKNGLKISLTNGEVISGSLVRYARDTEEQANKRLPHY